MWEPWYKNEEEISHKRLKFQKKNRFPEPDSSSEDEVGFDETTLCYDSSDELSDDESYVQTSLNLGNMKQMTTSCGI